MTRIEDRKDDELLYDLGGREHPSIFFLDAEGEVLARHDADDPSVRALEETGAKVARLLDLRKKAASGDEAAKLDLLIVQCDLGVIEFPDLETEIEGKELSAEQQRAVGALRADAAVSDMGLVLAKNRDQAARDMAAEEFAGLYEKGTHPVRAANRRIYWGVLADHAAAAKDAPMLKDALAGLRAALGDEPPQRALDRLRELEARLKELEAAK
ncbi:MAG TPA: hypothetical protein VFY93_09405 [Planctomycetota bacterium]|nr:hypothetical protein [Planctomycetota bacterium]